MPHDAGFCLCNDWAVGIRHRAATAANGCSSISTCIRTMVSSSRSIRPTVVTLSFHETPLVPFPFTGFVTDLGESAGRGYAMNVPLQPGAADDSWIECVDRVLPGRGHPLPARPDRQPARLRSAPQRSAGDHRIHTTRSFLHAAQKTRELAAAVCDGRWVATGGGGYQP
ncbi:MAG: hypothetical protein IPK26_31970 [Planctomycetes bacterium]|nr:hypothetical protein [Planctomycetota bacterium]